MDMVNLPNRVGWSPLMAAAQEGHHITCGVLLRAKAHVGWRDGRDRTALMEACEQGHHMVVQCLLSHIFECTSPPVPVQNNSINKIHPTTLRTCQTQSEGEVSENISPLVYPDPDPEPESESEREIEERAEWLAQVNYQDRYGSTCLHLACQNEWIETVEVIITHLQVLVGQLKKSPNVTKMNIDISEVEESETVPGMANVQVRQERGVHETSSGRRVLIRLTEMTDRGGRTARDIAVLLNNQALLKLLDGI